MTHYSISTWSLHRALGAMYSPGPEGALTAREPWGPGSWNLLDVPAELEKRGIRNLEICHFHFPRTDDAYLAEVRAALDSHGIKLFSILIDDGDISHEDPEQRSAHMAWIRGWIDIAGRAGVANVRVIAGNGSPDDPDAIARSVSAFKELSEYAEARSVRVMTENFHKLPSRPETLNSILDQLDGKVGLCADFGNYGGETKYDDLAAILPRADSCHAKANFSAEGVLEADDFNRCLDVAKTAGFNGPYTLIFEGPQPEWDGLQLIQDAIAARL